LLENQAIMDWLRVAEEWIGNYGWGARGKSLGISRMFAENDIGIIRREKLVASYRPRGILSGFLAVVPSLGCAVYIPPIAAKTGGPMRIRMRLSEELLRDGAVFSCYMTRERKMVLEDVLVWRNTLSWFTQSFAERWGLMKEFITTHWKPDTALQTLQITIASYISLDTVGEPEPQIVVEFVPNKAGQKRIIWIPAKEEAQQVRPAAAAQSGTQPFIVRRDIGPDVYTIWRDGTKLGQALVRTLATSRALRNAGGDDIAVTAEWNKQFEKWEVTGVKQ
jgi:hypothetical protein